MVAIINRQKSIAVTIESFNRNLWSPDGKDVFDYLLSRGYTADDIKAMGVGAFTTTHECKAITGSDWNWLNDKEDFRLTIPYVNLNGFCLGVWGRKLTPPNPILKENEFKYEPLTVFNEMDKDKNTLFCLATPEYGSCLYVVEGLFDALLASVRGVKNLIGLGGTELSDRSVSAMISNGHHHVIYIPDNDDKGAEGTDIVKSKLSKANIDIQIRHLPACYKDPDRFIIGEGIDVFKDIIDYKLS